MWVPTRDVCKIWCRLQTIWKNRTRKTKSLYLWRKIGGFHFNLFAWIWGGLGLLKADTFKLRNDVRVSFSFKARFACHLARLLQSLCAPHKTSWFWEVGWCPPTSFKHLLKFPIPSRLLFEKIIGSRKSHQLGQKWASPLSDRLCFPSLVIVCVLHGDKLRAAIETERCLCRWSRADEHWEQKPESHAI